MGTTDKAPSGAKIERVRQELAARDEQTAQAADSALAPAPENVQEPAAPAQAPDRDEAGPASDQPSGRPPLIEVAIAAAVRPTVTNPSQED